MATITVKNIPDEIYEKLKRSAEANHRSINSEIIVCIEQAVSSQSSSPQTVLEGARLLREKTAAYEISDEAFDQAKNAGRR